MVYNSNCLDSTSYLSILPDRKSDALSSDIFYLTFDLSELEISVSQKSENACLCRLLMESKAVVRFFALKRLNPEDIHTELLSVYEPDTFALLIVYKRHYHFVNGRTELCDDSRSGRCLRNDLT
jgi:hypothetical protein